MCDFPTEAMPFLLQISADLPFGELVDEPDKIESYLELARAHPELAELLPSCAIAVDARYATDSEPLHGEIAIVPPVSGG